MRCCCAARKICIASRESESRPRRRALKRNNHESSSLRSSLALLLPAAAGGQDWAKEKLEKSPRHREWVKVKHGDREVNCYVAYPEVKDQAPAVLVIHEIFGLVRLGQVPGRRIGRGRIHRDRARFAFRHGHGRRRHGGDRQSGRKRSGDPEYPKLAPRSDHGRLECGGRIRHQAPFDQR